MERTDILVIGSGAGGAPLASVLSRAGFHVLVLEKGPRYERTEYQHDEILMGKEFGFFVPRIEDEPHVAVIDGGGPHRTSIGWTACCVGGGTAHMGACLYRLHPVDFEMVSLFGQHAQDADWPYKYGDLEPYYCRAEKEIGVSGAAGANPFEGYRSSPYPMGPLPTHELAHVLDEVCKRMGLHTFPTPRAVNSRQYGDRPECSYECLMCSGFGCPTGARGSTQETLLADAEKTGRCQIRPNSMVREITVRPDGYAAGCIYLDKQSVQHKIEANVVCVCCSAIESARLLLLSRSALFPNGLGNCSGLVGQHLQFRGFSAGRGYFRLGNRTKSQFPKRNYFLGRSLADFYLLPQDVSLPPKGGIMKFDISRPVPIGHAHALSRDTNATLIWGDTLKKRLQE